MKSKSSRIFCLAVIVLMPIVLYQATAQQSTLYKLQPHKVQWAQQVLKDAIQKKDSVLLAEAYYLFGKTYVAAGDFKTAKDFYLKSLKIQERRGDSYELVRLYTSLESLANILMDFKDARLNAYRALSAAQREGSDNSLIKAYGGLRAFYEIDWSQGKVNSPFPKINSDSSFFYSKKMEPLVRKSKDSLKMLDINYEMAKQLLKRKDPRAIKQYINIYEFYRRKRKKVEQFSILTTMAGAYLQLKQPDQAYKMLQQALRVKKTFSGINIGDDNYIEGLYFGYYKAKGDFKKALEHKEKWFELERTKYLADREGALSRLSFDHEMDKKETQLKTQKRELATNAHNLQTQRIFIGVVLVLLAISSGIGVAFYRLSQKNQRISQHNAQLVKEQNHRVKNNLQVVSSLLSLHSNRLTDDHARQAVSESQLRVETMAILHRKLYDGDKLIVVNMPDFIKEVVEGVLQPYGFIDVEIAYDIDAIELKPNHALSVGLIINELCTNACKYALTNTEEPLITVSFKANDNKISLTFADNGFGFDIAQARKQQSFGLKLIQLQVDQLYGTCEFRTDNGTMFKMQFRTGK